MSDNLKNVVINKGEVQNEQNQNGNKPVKMYGSLREDAYLKFTATPFEADDKIWYLTNKEICEEVKKKFAETFHDLVGVMLSFNTDGKMQFNMQFFFKNNTLPLPEGKIKNVISLVDVVKNENNFYQSQKAISNSAAGNFFTISDETKLLLSNFMIKGRPNNMPNNNSWSGHITSFTTRVANDPYYGQFAPQNATETMLVVKDIDIRTILKHCLFGDEMVRLTVNGEDGSVNNIMASAFYNISFGEILDINEQIFSIKIDQFDPEAIKRKFSQRYPYVATMAPVGVKYF